MGKVVILVPYPAQGHVTPMLKLASALVEQGMDPLLVLPDYIRRRISTGQIRCAAIHSDGLAAAGNDFFSVEAAMEKDMPLQLQNLIHASNSSGGGGDVVAFMVADLLASYAINVAKSCGVEVVGFWPSMLASYTFIASIPNLLRSAIISADSGCPVQDVSISLAPGQPSISSTEMPWLIGTASARKARFKFWKRTLERSKQLTTLLVNTFPGEEDHQCSSNMMSMSMNDDDDLKIIPIRPLEYSYDDDTNNVNDVGGSFWEEDLSCLEWLDGQRPGSVTYISFGSWVSPIGEAEVKALAMSLEASRRPFLWVLGAASTWRKGLPRNFVERAAAVGTGKVVEWAPQMRVLKHEAVGCYLTHCGWNSTMEAIECKVRLLCYPVAGDQFLSCAYIVDAWRIGVRLHGFGNVELDGGIQKVMQDADMSKRILKLNHKLMGDDTVRSTRATFTAFLNTFCTPN